MPLTRRRFLAHAGIVAAGSVVLPLVGRVGAAFGQTAVDPSTRERRRLVLIYLGGGNDGLNTVVPISDAAGSQRRSVYERVRPTIRIPAADLLPLDRPADVEQGLGLHPALPAIHRLYQDGRVAVVQGVDYPEHSYSHFLSTDIWQSGQPLVEPDSGWLGRHLDRAGIGDGELRGLAIGTELPLALTGRSQWGVSIPGLPLRWADGTGPDATARHAALAAYGNHPDTEPLRHFWGEMVAITTDLVDDVATTPAVPATGNPLADRLLAARQLLEGHYGVECVMVATGGLDTHTTQTSAQGQVLASVDDAIATFLDGRPDLGIAPLAPDVADRTLLMTFSEFGRRIGENGSAGTDHGAAAPVFLISPPGGAVIPGLHGDHPPMGSTTLPADNLVQTTDMRALYQAVLTEWLGDPDPDLGVPLAGLFA